MTSGLGFNVKNENLYGWKKGWTWLKLNEKFGLKKTNLGYFPSTTYRSR
jgi:hypothetical protein